MVYNEAERLPRWLAYYGEQFGRENLYVIDHGSEDESSALLDGVTVIPLARGSLLDEIARAKLISDQVAELLEHHERVVFCDVDEFLAPFSGRPLREHLEADLPETVTAIGFDVMHRLRVDAPLSQLRPVLAQRPHVRFSPFYCKPLVTRRRVDWRPGFHFSDRPIAFGGLLLFHTRYADADQGLRRLAVTRNIGLAHAGQGLHWKAQDAEFTAVLERAAHADYRALTPAEVALWERRLLERLGDHPPNAVSRIADLADRHLSDYLVPEALRQLV